MAPSGVTRIAGAYAYAEKLANCRQTRRSQRLRCGRNGQGQPWWRGHTSPTTIVSVPTHHIGSLKYA